MERMGDRKRDRKLRKGREGKGRETGITRWMAGQTDRCEVTGEYEK